MIVSKLDRKDCFIMKAKRIILTVLLCIGLVLSALVGCGTDDSNSKDNGNENVTTDGVLEKDNADTDKVENVGDDNVIDEDNFEGIPCNDCKILGVEFTPTVTTFDEFLEAHPQFNCISGDKADDIVKAGETVWDVQFRVKDTDEYEDTYVNFYFKNTTDSELRLGDCVICRNFRAYVNESKPELTKEYPLLSINGLTVGDVFASVDDLNTFVGVGYEKVLDHEYDGYNVYRYVVNKCTLTVYLNIDTGTVVGLGYWDANNYWE